MEIRFSRYNAPFTEPPCYGVHFISLDDQLLMRSGHLTAHVQAYYAEKFKFHRVFLPDHIPFKPYVDSDSSVSLDAAHLEELYFLHGIQAAGRRAGRCS